MQLELTREGDDFTAYIYDSDMRPGYGYRVVIHTPQGETVYRRDPYAYECDFRSSWCMAVDPRLWRWQPWKIPDWDTYLIYELHVGSFTPEGTSSALCPPWGLRHRG
jgi:1,4-alpha-glucan branching enzyme